MDWLAENEAYIDCKGKKVIIKVPGEKVVVFRGQKQTKQFLSYIQTKRLLQQGCEDYLEYVVDKEKRST